jgi:hypothetical protein
MFWQRLVHVRKAIALASTGPSALRKRIATNITFLDIIHWPVFIQNTVLFIVAYFFCVYDLYFKRHL